MEVEVSGLTQKKESGFYTDPSVTFIVKRAHKTFYDSCSRERLSYWKGF